MPWVAKRAPQDIYERAKNYTFILTPSLFSSAAADHFRLAHIAFSVNIIKITFLFLYSTTVHHFSSAAFFLAARHLCFIGASIFAYEIKITLFPFKAAFAYDRTHLLSPPFSFILYISYTITLVRAYNYKYLSYFSLF